MEFGVFLYLLKLEENYLTFFSVKAILYFICHFMFYFHFKVVEAGPQNSSFINPCLSPYVPSVNGPIPVRFIYPQNSFGQAMQPEAFQVN